MNEREDILAALATAFAGHRGIGLSRVGNLVGCDGLFFREIQGREGRAPRSVRRTTYEKVLQRFSDIWPENLEWPEGVARPAPAPTTDA